MSKRPGGLREKVADAIAEQFADMPPDLFEREDALAAADAALKVVSDYFAGGDAIAELQKLSEDDAP